MSKRCDLSVAEKLELLKAYDQLPKMSQRDAAIQLKISQPFLCKLLRQRKELKTSYEQNGNVQRKRERTGKDKDVEAALKEWFVNVWEKDGRVSFGLLQTKAEKLAALMGKENFVATNGWLQRWLKCENIVYCGKSE